MSNWKRFKSWYSALFRKPPEFLRNNPGKIEEAFIFKGQVFYQFKDHFSIPTVRALHALDLYDELEMRCTKDFLKAHVAAVLDILNPAPGQRLDLTRLGRLVKNLEERLAFLPIPEHVYKLASVVYFTSEEDPFSYDRIAAAKNIALWKQDPAILSFFLKMQVGDLLPLQNMDTQNLNIFSPLVERINEIHRNAVLSKSSVNVTIKEM